MIRTISVDIINPHAESLNKKILFTLKSRFYVCNLPFFLGVYVCVFVCVCVCVCLCESEKGLFLLYRKTDVILCFKPNIA